MQMLRPLTLSDFEGERVYLAELGFDALDGMQEYSRMPEFYSHMEYTPHSSQEETREYLEKLLARVSSGTSLYWSIRLKDLGKVIGTFGVVNIDARGRKAEIGYGISPLYWHQGYFKEAANLVLAYCFEDIGFDRIAAITSAGNLPSINGLKRCGFKEEGRLREYYLKHDGTRFDAVVLGKLRKNHKSAR